MRQGFRNLIGLAAVGSAVLFSGCTTVYYDSPSTTVVIPAPPPPPPRYPRPHPMPGPSPVYQAPAPAPEQTVITEKTKTPRNRETPQESKDRPAGRNRKPIRKR